MASMWTFMQITRNVFQALTCIIFIALPVRAAVENQLNHKHWQFLSIKIQET